MSRLLWCMMVMWVASAAMAQDATNRNEADRVAISASNDAYVAAFNRGVPGDGRSTPRVLRVGYLPPHQSGENRAVLERTGELVLEKCDDMVQIQSLPGLETDVDFRILLGLLVPTVDIHQVGDDFKRPRAANQELHMADELSGCLVMLRPARVDGRPMLRLRSLSGSAVHPSCGVGK